MVARDYQSVVGAGIEKATRILEAEAYEAEVLPGAEAQAITDVKAAKAQKVQRIAEARGEAAAFSAVEESYRLAPELFEFRRLLEAREAQLAGQSFVVIDDRFERDGGAVWVSGSATGKEEE